MSLVILVPVLARPQNVAPLLTSIGLSTPQPHRILFLADPGDTAEHAAITHAGGWMLSPGGGYAAKVNAGVRATDEPLILLAADDVRPHPGWLPRALALINRGAHVVGLNDLIPRPLRPTHATHFLITREYAAKPCADGSRGPLWEGYAHWRTDDELIATATKRGVYAYCPQAIVEHVGHPMTPGGVDDDTYRKGRAQARLDGKRFARRAHLWA
jgi:hypothetical protein